jgi:hypothetical protein
LDEDKPEKTNKNEKKIVIIINKKFKEDNYQKWGKRPP